MDYGLCNISDTTNISNNENFTNIDEITNIIGTDDAWIGLKDEWIDGNGIVSSNSQYWSQINQAIMVIVLNFSMNLVYMVLDLMIYHVEDKKIYLYVIITITL